MRILFFIAVLFNFTLPAGAQFWAPVGDGFNFGVRVLHVDSTTNTLYAGGNFWYTGDIPVQYIAKWNGSSWDSLPSFPGTDVILAIATYNNQLYVGGFAQNNEAHFKRLNGNQWESVGGGTNGSVGDLKVYNNELYVLGYFDTVGTIQAHGIAKWDGFHWHSLNFPNYEFTAFVSISCMKIYNGYLYVGGLFNGPTGERVNIARYNGQNWDFFGGGLGGQFAGVADMEIYNNELYIAGRFGVMDGIMENAIVRWDGSQWHKVGGGLTVYPNTNVNGAAGDLFIYNNKLIAGGSFSYAGNVPANCIASWDGQEWCAFTDDIINGVSAITVFNNELYIGGGFDTIAGDSVNYIAKWVGGDYVDTCGAIIGVEELNENGGLNIYPNPAGNTITINAELKINNGQLTIMNSQGQVVYQCSMGNEQLTIVVSSFAAGIYYLSLQTNEGRTTKKIEIVK